MNTSINPEVIILSNSIINKPYFYKVFMYIVYNTQYDIKLLNMYCDYIKNYIDYNENSPHTLYDVQIRPFIDSFKYCTDIEKNRLNYQQNLINLYNNIIQIKFHLPLIQEYNIPQEVYNILFFFYDINAKQFARNLAILIFKHKK